MDDRLTNDSAVNNAKVIIANTAKGIFVEDNFHVEFDFIRDLIRNLPIEKVPIRNLYWVRSIITKKYYVYNILKRHGPEYQ